VLIIEVNDGELTDNATVTVNLNEIVNRGPVISDATFAIDENSAVGTEVGTVTASDPDGDVLTYSIVTGNDLGAFQLDASTGTISILDSEPLDFEVNPTFNLAIQVSDSELTDLGIITINLNDVEDLNQAPIVSNATLEIDENSPEGSMVGTVVATDPEGDVLTYAIASGNDLNAFQINSNSGELTVNDSDPLNFELNPSFNLAVEVSDGELSDVGLITINLNDLEEPLSIGAAFDEISLFPNPTTGIVVITQGEDEILMISVTDLNGKEIHFEMEKKKKNLVIDLLDSPAGIYNVHLLSNNGEMDLRVIKRDK